MSSRRDIFIDNGIYHVFNKTIDRKLIFAIDRYSNEFISRLKYYRSSAVSVRYSRYKTLPIEIKSHQELRIRDKTTFLYEIICYCLMPNHFHLLVRQKKGGAINRYLSNVVNSFTRYINLLTKRQGPLFLPQFQSRMMANDEQFIHTTRYIHLNPYSSGVVGSMNELVQYPYSSYGAYINKRHDVVVEKGTLTAYMNGNMEQYRKFVEDHAEHQRMLERVKHAEQWK